MKKILLALFCLLSAICYADPSYQQLYDNYYSLSSALAHDSVTDAQKAAKEMAKNAALLLEMPSLKQDAIEVKDLPKNEKETIRQDLATIDRLSKTILNVNKLDQMRKPFEELTAVMGGLQQRTKIDADEYYCPMVKKTWLQPKGSKQVENPYLGKSMMTCGEKKATGKK
jgi:hypothetical protein